MGHAIPITIQFFINNNVFIIRSYIASHGILRCKVFRVSNFIVRLRHFYSSKLTFQYLFQKMMIHSLHLVKLPPAIWRRIFPRYMWTNYAIYCNIYFFRRMRKYENVQDIRFLQHWVIVTVSHSDSANY